MDIHEPLLAWETRTTRHSVGCNTVNGKIDGISQRGVSRVSVFASIRGNFWLDAVSILRDHFFKNRMQLPLFSLLQIGASHVFDRIGLFRIRGIVDGYEYRKMILLLWKYPETNCINLKVKISRSKIIITSKSPILLK